MFGMRRGVDQPLVNVLFLDLNAYFASVEQQVRPELRGWPVAVIPLSSDATCCIAASYEARTFGIKTGTNVGEAKRLCPDLAIVEARHQLYIKFHHRIITAIETCLPVEAVCSIDEMYCRLMGTEREVSRAVEIAVRMKLTVRERVGEYLRCSIGLAPNRYLAKLATDMQKPDGLVVIHRDELPQRLYELELTDLPGIANRMAQQLHQRGIKSVAQLCALSEAEMVRAFNSVLGRTWYRWLRGDDVTDMPVHRRSVGHQHVLPPALRTNDGARAVAARLLHKAAARMRRLGYCAGRLTLSIRHVDSSGWWKWSRLPDTQDTIEMITVLMRLWEARPPRQPMLVHVVLDLLIPSHQVTRSLFADQLRRETLCEAMDRLNVKYGRNVLYTGAMHEGRSSAPLRIAFGTVPEPTLDL